MRKGEGTGLAMIISVIVLIIILTQYFILIILFPSKTINADIRDYVGSEEDIEFISFVELNSDLIIKSKNSNDYTELEEKMKGIYSLGDCINLQIDEKILKENGCTFEMQEYSTGGPLGVSAEEIIESRATRKQIAMNIPDYGNNEVKITLKIKNE